MPAKSTRNELALLVSVLVLLVWSGIGPHDRFTWVLEVAPILIGVPVLIWLYPTLRLTPLTYGLIWLHSLILMLGGHYTYAEVPLGYWMQDLFGFARNNYDRIGHFAQGFIPAMLAREIFIRRSPLRGSRWLPFMVVCFCLAFSALYELIEFWTALAAGGAATDFLGTQGGGREGRGGRGGVGGGPVGRPRPPRSPPERREGAGCWVSPPSLRSG